jgi:hypothetical protein
MSWKRPPKVTTVELTTERPFLRLVERRETRRDRMIACGLFTLLTAGGLMAGVAVLAVMTAVIAGYLGNDVLMWDYQYDHPPETEVAA